jgi:hypothetical protein
LEPTATWPIEAGEGTEGISLDVPSTIPRA